MARLNDFFSLLDRSEEQLVVDGERLKHELNQWIDRRVALMRAKVREIKTRFGGNRPVNGVRGGMTNAFDDDPLMVTASVGQLVVQGRNHDVSVNRPKPSTSTGRKGHNGRNVPKRTNQFHQLPIKQKFEVPNYVPPRRAERLTRTRPWYREQWQDDDQKDEDYRVDRDRASTSSGHKRKVTANKSQSHNKRHKTQESTAAGSNKSYVCKFPGCGKIFPFDFLLAQHERTHLGVKPFLCAWPNCSYGSTQRGNVSRHVLAVHFKGGNTVDGRDSEDYIREDIELAALRL